MEAPQTQLQLAQRGVRYNSLPSSTPTIDGQIPALLERLVTDHHTAKTLTARHGKTQSTLTHASRHRQLRDGVTLYTSHHHHNTTPKGDRGVQKCALLQHEILQLRQEVQLHVLHTAQTALAEDDGVESGHCYNSHSTLSPTLQLQHAQLLHVAGGEDDLGAVTAFS